MRLPDGRTLGYIEYGDRAGPVLFYFHGHPGSRLEAQLLAEPAAQHGVRLIGIDRPGMGLSQYQPGRRLRDWPRDVAQLANRLGIDSFAVAGFSGGGPYALACAYSLAERLTACGVISGVGPTSRLASFLALWLPWLLTPLAQHRLRDHERASQSLTRAAHKWVEPDRESLNQPCVRETMIASLMEAFQQGHKGAALDGALLAGRWPGIPLQQITFQPLRLWHGRLDPTVPLTAANKIAAALPQCERTYYPDDGHLSVIVNHRHDIIKGLAG
jgi:pimeloyl-ACP methyl ester carboxylesterase